MGLIIYDTPIEKAARFLYLNRTCFNGIYRVNMRGEFNVPYGKNEYKDLFEFERFRRASEIFQTANLFCDDFWSSLKNVDKGDLVFLDPPYTVSHIKNGFIQYNEKLFSWVDQKRLAEYIFELKKKKAFYILTNAKHEAVESLFGTIDRPVSVSRASLIGGKKAKRGTIEEYIFTNVR